MKLLSILIILILLLLSGCSNDESGINANSTILDTTTEVISSSEKSSIFVQSDTDGTDDGFEKLISKMADNGIIFYKTKDGQDGLIATDDVVLLEINCQWAERGGTNTDLIKTVSKAIINHPEGFTGEIVIADNGHGQYGSNGKGGSLDWDNTNSKDQTQSALDVVNDLKKDTRISGYLWDTITKTKVSEFSTKDMEDGFVIEDMVYDTGTNISYPKFTTEYGTHISFKEGIYDEASEQYLSDKLKVINMPVLKRHGLYQVTGAVKGYMGTASDKLTSGKAHKSIGTGGMGTQMANTRIPVLNIMDMIYVGVERGPGTKYSHARQLNMIAASLDPVALDVWCTKYVLIPEVEKLKSVKTASLDPLGTKPGTFGYWLRLSMEELNKKGLSFTMEEQNMQVFD